MEACEESRLYYGANVNYPNIAICIRQVENVLLSESKFHESEYMLVKHSDMFLRIYSEFAVK